MKVIRDDMVCFHLVFMYLTGAVNIIYQPKEYNRLSHISLVENKTIKEVDVASQQS